MATKTTSKFGNEALFPEKLSNELFNAVQGHSALAKLSASKPIPFAGEDVFMFSMEGEASIVGEGENKPAGDAAFTPKAIRPLKFVYQHRVTDEFVNLAEEAQIPYLQAFADGFAKKIARGLDIAAMHGVNPADLADASFKATNSFDGVITNTVTYAAATVDENIDDAIQLITAGGRVATGLALSPAAGAALSKIKVNGVAQFPEFRFGQNPDAFYFPDLIAGYDRTLDITGTGIMGYLDIEKIGVELPIYHGVSKEVLQVGVGHLPGTSFPVGGSSTHVVLSGHRGLPSAKLFSDLDKMELGDSFTITVHDRVLEYVVDQIKIVLPTESEDLQIEKGGDYCTLLTCTPYGINSHRLLVRGTRKTDGSDGKVKVYVGNEAFRIEPLIVAIFLAIPLIVVAFTILTIGDRRGRGRKKRRPKK